MLSAFASSILLLAGISAALAWMGRSRATERRSHSYAAGDELDRKVANLQALVAVARRESRRLEAAIAKAQSPQGTALKHPLAAIEALGDAAALEDPQALQRAAAELPRIAPVADATIKDDEKTLRIVRLLDQGHSPAEIARRVGLPIGEVELRLSLR